MRTDLKGLFRINPIIMWSDFLFHLVLGYSSFALSQKFMGNSPFIFLVLVTISAFSLYRAVIFIHEIAHARRQMPVFTVIWNLLCGVPLGMPSFLYYQSHYLHHRAQTYGTKQDGEYLAFGGGKRIEIVKYLVFSFFVPVLMLGRFAILTLPSFFIPPLRRWMIAHASSLVIENKYIGIAPQANEKFEWIWQETLTALSWITISYLVITGFIPLDSFICFFLLMCALQIVNALRTLAAHRFVNNDLLPMDLESQYLDSVNLTGTGIKAVINTLFAPVGLRFHAIHHLFPGLPYHALPEAHRRLSKSLSKNSNYHLSNEPTVFSSLNTLWRAASHKQ